jgi:HSP20 family protein
MALARRERSSALADLIDRLERGFPSRAGWRAGIARMRLEDFEEGGRYVVRAEMPGIDPERDVDITLTEGMLTIRAERREERREKQRSEFHYGSFVRRVSLPRGATEQDVEATYANGILTVSVPLPREEERGPRRVPVMRRSGD